ncbi:hypothetical protein Lepto7375DRAFT_8041 [Leptolyngbya sp. PCC 7375]|nr:hypothetical protein Lepto7375DRAFT_8041 [Leptolyngbya sp. PCC 7375]
MLRSLISIIGALVGNDDSFVDYDDTPDDMSLDLDDYDIVSGDNLNLHPTHVNITFGSSADTGTYDPNTGEATFPDGTTAQDPYQDSYGQIYKTKDDWVNGTNPYEQEPSDS